MPNPARVRAPLAIAAIVVAVGITVPLSSGGAHPAQLLGTVLTPRIPEVGNVGARQARGGWSDGADQASAPTSPTTSTPQSPPRPPAPPPAPPPYGGGLQLVSAHIVFTDSTAGRLGWPADLQAASGILIDADTHQIFWQRNMHQSRPPASTAKIVSSLVALNNFSPHRMVTVTPDALTQASDETRMGIQAGQRYSVEDLLSGMLTVSANDAATAMAVDTVGLDNFVAGMNAQMQRLGLHDSHFTTPVGLDDPMQYTSAYDLAAVGLVDMSRFATFRNIVWRSQVNLLETATHPQFQLPNLNRLLEFYPYAIGIKPGWTGNAGACLVGMAQRGSHHLIVVVMDDPKLYTDATNLLKWGFQQYGYPPNS